MARDDRAILAFRVAPPRHASRPGDGTSVAPAADVHTGRFSAVTRQALRCAGEIYVVVVSATAVAELTKLGPRGPLSATVGMLLTPVMVGFGAVAVHSIFQTGRTWSRGRRGAGVGRALASLRDGYRVLSRLPITQRRDDRIVVGANGVFVVVTDEGRRGNDGALWRGMIDDCQIEALRVRARVRRALRRPFPVHAVLCVTEGVDQEIRHVQGVRIVDTERLATMIVNTFTTAPLGPADVEAAVAALTASTLERVSTPRRHRPRQSRQELRSERRLMLV
jgi:hypothetical protein